MRKVSKVKIFAELVAIVLHLTLAKGFQREVYGMAGVLSHFENKYDQQSGSTDTWTITVPIGYHINLTIVYFKGNSHSGIKCPDHVEVKDVLSNQTVECTSKSPFIYSSKQRVLQVIFNPIESSPEYFATFRALNGKDMRGCDINWTLIDDSCYVLREYQQSHRLEPTDEAQDDCKKEGANLTSVNTKQENDMLRAMLKQHSRDTFKKVLIGLQYSNSSRKFVHIDNTPVIFTAWIIPPSFGPWVTLRRNGSWSESSNWPLKNNKYYSCEKRVLSRNMPYKECSLPVGLQNQSMVNISASTQHANFIANSARLYGKLGWVPNNGDSQPWIEISFESPFLVTAFATQGNEKTHSWVARFSLSFVLYDKRYVNFTNPRRQIVYFEGNRDAHNVAYNRLPYPIVAKTVRLVPEKTQSVGLRMEFYGCPSKEAYVNCSQPLGLETSAVPDELMTGSSHHPSSPPHNARLNLDLDSQFSCWSPSIHDTDQWLQIDFGSNKNRVTAIATQGRGDDEVKEWVTKYALSYAEYRNIFTYYKENNLRKNFRGNSDKATVVKNTLDLAIVVFALRIHPREWKNNISMRLEVYGCQVNDSYTAWGNWSDCNAWCNGLQNRTRHCKSSYPYDCPGTLVESRRCNISNCFSSWTNWTECNQTCGSGVRNRTKYYLGDFSNKTCNGSITEIGECNRYPCNASSTCNMTCGIGFKKSYINCTDPSQPSSCETQVQQCNQTNKPGIVDSIWSDWSDCKSTCGGIYYQERSRSSMSNNSNLVYKTEVESRECVYLCNESCICTWSNWTDCNATCGGGARTRVFNCSYTSLGLVNCSGSIHDTMVCNNFSCPVNGNFTEWSNWTNCTTTCGNGTRQRMRNCTNPQPAHGGNNCTGNTTEIQECWTLACPAVDGNFTEWGNWTNCTATCGNGTRQRTRNCTNPPPAHGGKNCTGNTTEIQECGTLACPADGNFTEWGNWTNCTATCGNGTRQRTRNCTNPSPAHGGKNCTGNTTEIQECRTQPCPVNGNLTEWGNWTNCTATCGNGTRQRTRNCTNPSPAHGGKNCTGNTTEIQECGNQPCSDTDGNFTEWSPWTNCTKSCGTGTQWRMRTCTSPLPANGGANCSGHSNETQNCHTHHCPIHGDWTSWSEWSYCNRPCGIGYENSTRSCTKPAPKYGGRKCAGPSKRSRTCNNFTCPAAEVLVNVHFTKENWTNDLNDLNSEASLKLKEKILKNLQDIYEGQDINVTHIEINSFSKGSIITNFTIFFIKMDNLQLVILQDKMETTGLLSTMPVRYPNFNTTKVPSLSPTILTINNQTSTSIFLTWTHVPSIYLHDRNLSGYSIFYRERTGEYLPDQQKSVASDKNRTFVDVLKKYSEYSLRILAFTESGNGISSKPIDFKTDEDVPSASPLNLRLTAPSSTKIAAEWDHIDPAFIHGILLGYNVTVTNLKSGGKKFQLHGSTDIYSLVENLEKYTSYSVVVCGFTSKGCGKTAEGFVQTLEDAPNKPPRDVKALNLSSTFKLKVTWSAPEEDGINGILRGHTLRYKIKSMSKEEVEEARAIEIDCPPSDYEYTLENLTSFTLYEIMVAARTNVGQGPFARIYGETCRCQKTFNTNYWYLTPYLNKTSSGQVQGIFSHIIRNMITWACADCKNGHGKTVVDFTHDGSGSHADKRSMLDVIANIHHGVQISFPINGNKYINRVYGGHPFVPIVESPGVAFLSQRHDHVSPAWNILNSVLNMFPFILLSLLFAYLAGVIVWFLDADALEDSSFPRSFIKGAAEGMWWSFVSMTTVGYGDRSPKKYASRLFAMLWTLYGMVLVSIITSSVTTSLTTVTVGTTKKIYGLPIAAIQNSSEYRLGILMNGKVNQANQYHSVKDIHDAIVKREVEGALIDTYVVAMDNKRFTDDNILVTKLLERPFGYGIALSIGAAASIERQCRDYLILHQKEIFSLIERSTGQLKKPKQSLSVERASGLFDPNSILYRNTVLFVGCLLLLAILCGLVWHFMYKVKYSKVNPAQRIEHQQREKTRIILRQIVDEFYIAAKRKIQMLREKHRKELILILKREKKEEEQEGRNSGQVKEDDDLNIVFKTAFKLIKR